MNNTVTIEEANSIVLRIFAYFARHRFGELPKTREDNEKVVLDAAKTFAYVLNGRNDGTYYSYSLIHDYISGKQSFTAEQLNYIMNYYSYCFDGRLDNITDEYVRHIQRVCRAYNKKLKIIEEALWNNGYLGVLNSPNDESMERWCEITYKFLKYSGYAVPPPTIFKEAFYYAYKLGKRSTRTTNE